MTRMCSSEETDCPHFLGSGLRQHALLHLVRVHYIRGEYAAARQVSSVPKFLTYEDSQVLTKYLTAALSTARICGDKPVIQQCIRFANWRLDL